MTTVLLRLVHIYELGDDPVYSEPTLIELASYIKFVTITSIAERTLTVVC